MYVYNNVSIVYKDVYSMSHYRAAAGWSAAQKFRDRTPCKHILHKKLHKSFKDRVLSAQEQVKPGLMDVYSTYRRCTLRSKRLAGSYWALTGSLGIYDASSARRWNTNSYTAVWDIVPNTFCFAFAWETSFNLQCYSQKTVVYLHMFFGDAVLLIHRSYVFMEFSTHV